MYKNNCINTALKSGHKCNPWIKFMVSCLISKSLARGSQAQTFAWSIIEHLQNYLQDYLLHYNYDRPHQEISAVNPIAFFNNLSASQLTFTNGLY